MPNLNKVMIMGNLTRDPELRYTPSNTPVVQIGVAVNRRWRSQQGEQQEETTFIDCEGWGRTAEVINEYLRKGRPIFIEGRLKLDQWQDKEGNNRSKLKVVIESFQFVDSRGGGGDDSDGQSGGGGQSAGGGYSGGAGRRSSSGAGRGSGGPSAGASGGPPLDEPHQPVDEQDIPF